MNPYSESDLITLSKDGKMYANCVAKWGVRSQIEMVIEELSELILAIQKWKRDPCERQVHDIASEVADVELMLGQLQYMMDSITERKYGVYLDYERYYKRKRLRMRLKNSDDQNPRFQYVMREGAPMTEQHSSEGEGGGEQ